MSALRPLLGAKRTLRGHRRMTASDPEGDIGWIEMPQRSSLLPYRGVLSFLSKAREASGSETAHFHYAAGWRRGSMAARGACAAAGEAADHRVLGREHIFGAEPADFRLCAAVARTRLD